IIASSLWAQGQTSGDPTNGKRIFERNGCYECHNYNASGSRQGARLANTKLTAAGLIAYVRKPRTMPAYSTKVMTDQELTDVWAYLRSLPEPLSAKSIAILNLD